MLGDDLLKVFEKIDEEMGDVYDPKKFEEIVGRNSNIRGNDSLMSNH